MTPEIYHGTPLTPRAALETLHGRNWCVSFYRPDNAEVVARIANKTMFRQWRFFVLAGSDKGRQGMGRTSRLDPILQMVGVAIDANDVGRNPRHARSAQPAQRRTADRLAVRSQNRRTTLAHGRATASACQTMRAIRPRVSRLGWARQGQRCGVRGLLSAHGRGGGRIGKHVAETAHDARRFGRAGISFQVCGQHKSCAKWMAL